MYRAELDPCVKKLIALCHEFDRIADERKLLAERPDGELTQAESEGREQARAVLDDRQRKAEAAWSRTLDLTLKGRPCVGE